MLDFPGNRSVFVSLNCFCAASLLLAGGRGLGWVAHAACSLLPVMQHGTTLTPAVSHPLVLPNILKINYILNVFFEMSLYFGVHPCKDVQQTAAFVQGE